eukprot:4836103-Prymnesium_polylepis.2
MVRPVFGKRNTFPAEPAGVNNKSAPNPRSFPNSHLIITRLMQKVLLRAAALSRKTSSKTEGQD